jgi:hypothetical protein
MTIRYKMVRYTKRYVPIRYVTQQYITKGYGTKQYSVTKRHVAKWTLQNDTVTKRYIDIMVCKIGWWSYVDFDWPYLALVYG